ncbi:GCN5-related N-acetyltransferase [Pirellula staleyi DSM 6068]|uniref:GCN5-related N-acetyltransferase n=1 Tax=Pirellula staleyi (strain ATCC 27377 / DSM 6068 / ICPB 4128) TaxID=530564 RepID=D2R8W4_PIRSD|nr:GNAT family N-acetyltransferase [Pirellula staleyi]ADB19414.1 GCN5-related N-acetyltransferase [Pirellula staleyi DSM 6068]
MPAGDTWTSSDENADLLLLPPQRWHEVLPELIHCWSENERQQQLDRLIAAAEAGQFDHFRLYAKVEGEKICVAMLVELLTGNVANCWPPAVIRTNLTDLAQEKRNLAQLGATIRAPLAREHYPLVQSLIDSSATEHAERLAATGFVHAGRLAFFGAATARLLTRSNLTDAMLTLEPASSLARGDLEALIESTYEQSLDAPLIEGIRATRDVLTGYAAVGTTGESLWHIARNSAGQIVGCLLLAQHTSVSQLELVYVGIVPQHRGQRYGQALTQQALAIARDRQLASVVLAVDLANDPAIAMYAACGFVQLAARDLWILKTNP